MKEAQLRDFIAVVDEGGVRAAARKLGISQAAVSHNLLALERECGHALLLRGNHGIELTEFGRILLRRARAAGAELRKAREEMGALSGRMRGDLAVGISPVVEASLMSSVLTRFHQKFPDTLVRVTTGPGTTTSLPLREGQLDFAIGSATPIAGGGLVGERLMSVDLAIVVRKGHPKSGATSLADLVDCEWVAAAPASAPQADLNTIFREHGLPAPRITIQRDAGGLMHLLARSDRVALTSQPSARLLCDYGVLELLPVRERMEALVIYLVTVRGRPLRREASALAAEFRRQARAWRR